LKSQPVLPRYPRAFMRPVFTRFSSTVGFIMILFCAAMLTVAAAAAAQEPAAPPAHLSFVEGVVTIERDGQIDSAVLTMPLLEGDRLRTANGRAEVTFPDGTALALERDSEIEFVTAIRVRVLAGEIEHRAARIDPQSPSTQNLPPDLQPYAPDL